LPPETDRTKNRLNEPRDTSRLLVLNRPKREISASSFPHIIDYLQAGDVNGFNDSRVLPAVYPRKKSAPAGKWKYVIEGG